MFPVTIDNLRRLAVQCGAVGFDYEKNGAGVIDWYRLRYAFEAVVPMVSVDLSPERREPTSIVTPEPVPVEPIFAAAGPDMADFATDAAMGAVDIPFANIPQAMRAVPRWCVWQKHENGLKVPYSALPGGLWSPSEQCKSNDPSVWVSFDEALHCFLKSNGHLGGLSFALGDGWAGVDFDDVIVDGRVHPQVEAWLASLGGYQEISQSQEGIKTVFRGVLSDRFLGSPGKTGRKFKGIPSVGTLTEVYHTRRFFFLTGNGSGEPRENQAGLNAFCDRLLSLKEAMQPKPTSQRRVKSSRKMKTWDENIDRKALDSIKPDDLSYDEWLSVITACKSAGLSCQEGRRLEQTGRKSL